MPRGVVLRHFAAGISSAGGSLAEWAYITPRYPTGLRTGSLHSVPSTEQIETAEFWFLSNFQPFVRKPYFVGFGTGPALASDVDQPEQVDPMDVLRQEFGGVINEVLLAIPGARLTAHAASWTAIVDRSDNAAVSDDDATLAVRIANAEQSIDRLQRAVDALAPPGALGHNRGPALDGDLNLGEVIQSIHQARGGVTAGEAGISMVSNARSSLVGTAAVVVAGLLKGLATEVGKNLYPSVTLLTVHLLQCLHEAAIALGHLLAAYPPTTLM